MGDIFVAGRNESENNRHVTVKDHAPLIVEDEEIDQEEGDDE